MDQSWWTWLVLGGLMLVMLFLPQWQARRREQKKRAELQEGVRVVTIGGFIDTLTYYNPDENRARIQLAEGFEAEILAGAIARRIEDAPEAPRS
jgi:preprotein translocase subunit YajC